MSHPDCECGPLDLDCDPAVPECGPNVCGDLDGWIVMLDRLVGALRWVFRPRPPDDDTATALCPIEPGQISWSFQHPAGPRSGDCDVISVIPMAFDGTTAGCGSAKLRVQIYIRRCWPGAGKGSTPETDAARAATSRILMRSIQGIHAALESGCERCPEGLPPMVVTSSRTWRAGEGAGWFIEATTAY